MKVHRASPTHAHARARAQVTCDSQWPAIAPQTSTAVYVFPLEEKAAITDFVAYIDGKKIRGVVQEKEQARDTYVRDSGLRVDHNRVLRVCVPD